MPPQIICCISSYECSCHGPFYVLLIASQIFFFLIDSLIFQHGLCSKSMQSSSWRCQDCWSTGYKVKNWLLYASLMGHQLSLKAWLFREFRWSCGDEQPIADLVQSGFVCSCIFNGFHCWLLGKISLPVPAGYIFFLFFLLHGLIVWWSVTPIFHMLSQGYWLQTMKWHWPLCDLFKFRYWAMEVSV